MSTLEIRDATPAEHAPLGRLLVEAYASLAGFPSPAEQPAYYEMLADIGRFADPPRTRLLVATRAGALLGGLVHVADLTAYGAVDLTAHAHDGAGFRLLGVAPDARGLGVGRALAEASLALARAAGRRQVVIHTTAPMTVARGLYARLGFVRAPDLDFAQGALPVVGFRLALG